MGYTCKRISKNDLGTGNVERIKLTRIDTSVAAKNFAKRIQEKKTFFLDGRWGSGKTEFLNTAEKYSKKNFAKLDIWNTKDSRSLMEIAFFKLHPILHCFMRIVVMVSVVVSILATPAINLGLENLMDNNLIKIGLIVALFVTVWRILKIKSDAVYSWLITMLCTKKILIIDDFDRADEERQKEAYKLFNTLHERNKLPIVFVGDFSKIASHEDNYLQKIIDNKIELPYALYPKEIWDDYFKQIAKNFHIKNISRLEQFKQIFIQEGRNLRDREHFDSYVTQELIDGGKCGHVQIIQQLLVIYIYIFYPLKYQNLLEDLDISTIFSKQENIGNLLQDNGDYPVPFDNDRKNYFLFENVSNMTSAEAEERVSNLANNNYLYSDRESDFYQYFKRSYNMFSEERKNNLFSLALKYAREFKITPIVEYIFAEERNHMERYDEQKYYQVWIEKLDNGKVDLDDSEKIYILQSFWIFSFEELARVHENIALNDEILEELKLPSYYILLYFTQKNIWGDFSSWDDNIWKFVDSMNDRNYLAFWIMQGVLDHHLGYEKALIFPDDNQYTIITDPKSEEGNETKKKNRKMVLAKVKGRLEELGKKGYTFNES